MIDKKKINHVHMKNEGEIHSDTYIQENSPYDFHMFRFVWISYECVCMIWLIIFIWLLYEFHMQHDFMWISYVANFPIYAVDDQMRMGGLGGCLK